MTEPTSVVSFVSCASCDPFPPTRFADWQDMAEKVRISSFSLAATIPGSGSVMKGNVVSIFTSLLFLFLQRYLWYLLVYWFNQCHIGNEAPVMSKFKKLLI